MTQYQQRIVQANQSLDQSVVAMDEINGQSGKIAKIINCAQAAKDTATLIEESIAKSNDGKVKVDQVATAIRTVTEEAARANTLVDQVSRGSEEQAQGIEQVARAITQMQHVTQQTAASAEESAAAAEELTAQPANLQDIVGRPTEMVGGSVGRAGIGIPHSGERSPARLGAPSGGARKREHLQQV